MKKSLLQLEKKFVDNNFCQRNGFSQHSSARVFAFENKQYYQKQENYDWVKVADNLLGLEAILHRCREREIKRLIKKFAPKGKFLDAGCGTGLILRHLPAKSIGVDINPRNIAKAKIHAPKAKLVRGDIEKLTFPKNTFSTIICSDVLEHLIEPDKAWRELFRVLEPGGMVIGSVPRKSFFWQFRFLSSTHPGEPYHKLYNQKEVRALFGNQRKVLLVKRGCWRMSYLFVVKK